MSTENIPPLINTRSKNHKPDFIQQVQLIVSIAVVVATLFTAWTPSTLLPSSIAEKISSALSISSKETQVNPYPTITPRPKPRIGIVAGHWGNDSGAVCPDGLTEAQINLNITTLVKQNLLAEDFEVDILKEFDERLDHYQALALVSIHTDSCQYINDEATGYKVAAALSTSQPEKTSRLRACISQRYSEQTGLRLHSMSVTPDMTSYHAFAEIDPETPAVIIETGFMNLDRQFLTQSPNLAAKGISNGILCFIYNENLQEP